MSGLFFASRWLPALLLAVGGLADASEFPIGLGGVPPTPNLNPFGLSCSRPVDPLELALWRVTTEGGRPDRSCGNAFTGFLRTPRTATQPDAFDVTADQIRGARAEVLLTSMEWQAGEGRPGWTFARALRDLYLKVRANPADYPQGMTVRVVLGGFPDLGRPDGATQPLELVRDLTRLGVPLNDPAAGWRLGVANYRYFPHSHVKLHVIDGQDVTVAGYNYTAWHLPDTAPGGKGLHDLGLRMRGPAAQDGVTVFNDLWRKAQQVRCPPEVTAENLFQACTLGPAEPPTHPGAARVVTPAGEARAFLLYRRPGFDQADRAMVALFGAARQRLDLMQAQFSPGYSCWWAYQNPDACPVSEWPVYLRAVLGAMERGVKVRALMVDYGIDRAPNRSGAALLRLEARRRGLEDRFEARYVTFPMHTKALTVDGRMVVAGSMNLHFSSWGPLGLNETMLATTDPGAVAQQQASFEDVWATRSREVPQEWWMRNVPGRE
ncbi:phospholipase D-like domains [Deinococcus aerius]|uniref:phospholipase D n=2 Tax=Deinococcus TaxID=1298 RepID=A0A2I9CSI8_9DEIO|nr:MULTISPECIES: phospholipase D-like domain-containing protein [Deinococcus]MBB5293907.1 cardiolipin synthase [Deinococcus metallilatus]QBY07150.1 phospholipase [Deinococcus metallilatus]RXJ14622.1 phospholipase [Deinococcus metallilatus]TLK30742.1 phospholipase [Deinococcus metallilatus]GBF04633.1 phospholipase D-like domains [Deinococcus aerius]